MENVLSSWVYVEALLKHLLLIYVGKVEVSFLKNLSNDHPVKVSETHLRGKQSWLIALFIVLLVIVDPKHGLVALKCLLPIILIFRPLLLLLLEFEVFTHADQPVK